MNYEPVHTEDAAPDNLQEKNVEGRAWIVRKILGHRVAANGQLELQIDWDGPYDAKWEPRRNIPEELVSKYCTEDIRRENAAK